MPSNKFEALREEGTLNPRPEAVADPRFEEDGFFDPRDVVQVKYEMLRRVRVEELPITRAAAEAGCSRQTFYDARANFERAGIAGLVPKKRGPRGRHKLRGEVLEFLQTAVSPGQPIHAAELVVQVEQRFGVHVHPRSIERALRDTKKNLG